MRTNDKLVRNRIGRIVRLVFLAGCLPVLLAGCLSQVLPPTVPSPVTYDFGPLPDEPSSPLPVAVRLNRVTAPSWLDSRNIYYRRLDEDPAALRPYAQNVWIASTPELFEERLAYRLARALPAAGAAQRPLNLDLELVSFEHVYESASEAFVVALVRAAFEDEAGRVRSQTFERRQPASAAVGGATTVMPRVANELLVEVVEWLRRETAAREPEIGSHGRRPCPPCLPGALGDAGLRVDDCQASRRGERRGPCSVRGWPSGSTPSMWMNSPFGFA